MFQNGLKNKDIDLLKVYKQKKEASPYVGTLKYLVFPISAAVILISWFGIVTYQNHALDSDIAAAKAELKQVQKQIAEDPNLEKYQSLQKAMNDVEKYKTLHKDIQSYPQLSQNTFDQILIASIRLAAVPTALYCHNQKSRQPRFSFAFPFVFAAGWTPPAHPPHKYKNNSYAYFLPIPFFFVTRSQ